MGPIETAMQSHAAEVRRRLRGEISARPISRALLAPPAPTVSGPVGSATPDRPAIATTKARALVVEVAKAHGLNWRELIGASRTRRVVLPRNEAAFRLITELGLSYPQAGRVLGGKDHTTVLHSCRRHAETSAEAAEIWRRHVECETTGRQHKHEEALRLYFEGGLTASQISSRVKVMPITVHRWVERANASGSTEFPPLSTLPTDQGEFSH